MTDHHVSDDVPGALARLRRPAPALLGADVLQEVGLRDRMAPLDTPFGRLWIAWNGRGVAGVDLGVTGEAAASHHADRVARPTDLVSELPGPLRARIERRLAGDRRSEIPLDLRGRTPFEVEVWAKTAEIPHGEVRPYGWVAAEIGRPRAVRAVGTALGHNPVPLVVPCHRVVRTDGTIGQYSLGGPSRKRAILATEGIDPDGLEAAARRGERLTGSTTTKIVCWPTCRNARRIAPANRIAFRNLVDAAGAGYRPCRVCRPTAIAA
jgi:O-6-methylguanine DNA methyltransferase